MLSAFTRIGLIALSVSITFIMIIFMLRTVGYQNPVMDPPHPWYKDQVWIITPWDCEDAPPAGAIALLKLEPKSSSDWQVICKNGTQELSSVIQKFALRKIMFRLQTPEPPAAQSLSDYVSKIDAPLEVGVWAPVSAVGRDLRKIRPDWIFALDPAAALQFETLTQLYLETWASLWADFWIEDVSLSSTLQLKGRARAEIIRRNKKIIAVDHNEAEWPQDAKGILTTRPSYWLTHSR